MKLDFGQGEKEVVISLYTLVIYEAEFGTDMIQDVFGRMALRKDDKADDEIFVMDFRDTNWVALTKALWAGLKAADDSVHPYKEWVNEVEEFDMYSMTSNLMPELQRKLFRSGAAASE